MHHSFWRQHKDILTSIVAGVIGTLLIGAGLATYTHLSYAAGPMLKSAPKAESPLSITNDACLFSWDCLWDWQRTFRKVIGTHTIEYRAGGRVEITTPDVIVNFPEGTNHIDYGMYLLHSLRQCKIAYENTGLRSDAGHPLELYLGIDPGAGDSGFCCSLSPRGAPRMVYTYRNAQSLEDEIRRVNLPRVDLADIQCTGDHELAHWFTYNTHFGWFLNEGFAVYMDYSQRDPERLSPYRCYTNGYQQAPDTFFGSVAPYIDLHLLQRPYSELTTAEHTELISARYCFWKNIEQRYGQSAVISIVNQQRRAPQTTFVNNFSDLLYNIQTAIIPVVGDDFYAQLAGFGIYPADFATVR